jgi:hypothetical protein
MPAKGTKHAPEALGPGGRISRGTKYGAAKRKWLEERVRELEAALYAVEPADLALLRKSGAMTETVERWHAVASAQVLRLRRSAEGEPDTPGYRPLSEGQVAALSVAQRHLLLGFCEQARALLKDDGESATRAGAQFAKFLATTRDAIGLGPREIPVPDLTEYLERKSAENRAQQENSTEDDSRAEDARKGVSTRPGGGAPGGNVRPDPATVSTSTTPDDREEA